MNFASMVLAVCHPQKLVWVKQVLDSFDSSETFKFDKKTIAIDEFNGWRFPNTLHENCRRAGWVVVKDNHKSRPKSMIHAMKFIRQDVVFYHEDDVLVNFPARADVEKIFSLKSPDGRECGICSLNIGGTEAWFSGHSGVGDLELVEKNTLEKFENYFCFLRSEEMRDPHFFEFPGMFVRTDILNKLLAHAMVNCTQMQIEKGLTKAWFDLGFDKKYFKCSVAKNNLPEIVRTAPKEIFKQCRLLTNLDPMQGNSGYFGSHHI